MSRWLAMALGAVARRSEKSRWDSDKQCYIMEHVDAPSCVAPMSESCPTACVGQIESL
jgi:hypothetical protein